MQRPFSTNIFLDSGNPDETRQTLDMLGFLDGQTTNPSLVAKNPAVQALKEKDGKLSTEDLLKEYKKIIQDINVTIPDSAISIEVYADATTTAENMIEQAHELMTWLPAPYIKLPITHEGLCAAHELVKEGIRINMTLCFSQEQALAVHYATLGAQPGQVFISPFVGRLDDKGICGVSVVANISQHYRERNSHVRVLAASIRSTDHIYACLKDNIDIMTIPFSVIQSWVSTGILPPAEFNYSCDVYNLQKVPYQEYVIEDWTQFDIHHELTDVGVQKFAHDWNDVLGEE
jgi:transaldolase